jgi:3-oxoacyl-[acyl-carrier protein] reductase
MARAYVALGSNIGDRAATIAAAVDALRQTSGIQVIDVSSNHETKPVGGPPGQGDFLNAAAAVETSLTPHQLLQTLLNIEKQLGRVRSVKNAPRTIDLDILLFDDVVLNTDELTIPHPRMHERGFVLAPLAEIGSEVTPPDSSFSVRQLLANARGHHPPELFLDGLRVLVTGSTSGIGKEIALSMSRLGADVIIHGRKLDKAKQIAEVLRVNGRRSSGLNADFSDDKQVASLADSSWSHWNSLDILVNNAGADTLTDAAGKWSFEQKLDALLQVDVRATMQLSRMIGAKMKERGRGCIINIGWDQAETGMEGDSGQLFGASKAAVMAFTKSLAKTLAPEVRVNCIAPGWIKTAWGETASQVWHDRVKKETPLGRWGIPADIAAAAVWLASPAASFITGQILRVNGGVVM